MILLALALSSIIVTTSQESYDQAKAKVIQPTDAALVQSTDEKLVKLMTSYPFAKCMQKTYANKVEGGFVLSVAADGTVLSVHLNNNEDWSKCVAERAAKIKFDPTPEPRYLSWQFSRERR